MTTTAPIGPPSAQWLEPHPYYATPERVYEATIRALRDFATEQDTSPASPWLTAAEAAQYLRISRNLVYELAARGEIPSSRVGGKILFHKAELDNHLRSV